MDGSNNMVYSQLVCKAITHFGAEQSNLNYQHAGLKYVFAVISRICLLELEGVNELEASTFRPKV